MSVTKPIFWIKKKKKKSEYTRSEKSTVSCNCCVFWTEVIYYIYKTKVLENKKTLIIWRLGDLAFGWNFKMHLKDTITFIGEFNLTFSELLNAHVQHSVFQYLLHNMLFSNHKNHKKCLIHELTTKCSGSMIICIWTFWHDEAKTTPNNRWSVPGCWEASTRTARVTERHWSGCW